MCIIDSQEVREAILARVIIGCDPKFPKWVRIAYIKNDFVWYTRTVSLFLAEGMLYHQTVPFVCLSMTYHVLQKSRPPTTRDRFQLD